MKFRANIKMYIEVQVLTFNGTIILVILFMTNLIFNIIVQIVFNCNMKF